MMLVTASINRKGKEGKCCSVYLLFACSIPDIYLPISVSLPVMCVSTIKVTKDEQIYIIDWFKGTAEETPMCSGILVNELFKKRIS